MLEYLKISHKNLTSFKGSQSYSPSGHYSQMEMTRKELMSRYCLWQEHRPSGGAQSLTLPNVNWTTLIITLTLLFTYDKEKHVSSNLSREWNTAWKTSDFLHEHHSIKWDPPCPTLRKPKGLLSPQSPLSSSLPCDSCKSLHFSLDPTLLSSQTPELFWLFYSSDDYFSDFFRGFSSFLQNFGVFWCLIFMLHILLGQVHMFNKHFMLLTMIQTAPEF